MLRKILSLAFVLVLFLIFSVPGKAMTVACTNCSDVFTQMMERITNLEELQTALKSYQEAITQTEQQIALVQNNLQQYENMIQNTRTLPEDILRLLSSVFVDLAKDTNVLNLQKGDYMALGQIFDSIYPGLDMIKGMANGQSDLSPEEIWNKWSSEVDRASQATFQMSGAQLQDISENSDALNDYINKLLTTPEGQMQAIQAGNNLAGIQIAESQKLRALIATNIQSTNQYALKNEKNEQVAVEQWRKFTQQNPLDQDQQIVLEDKF
jgi:P-type conjugative transfer protein TrbJ